MKIRTILAALLAVVIAMVTFSGGAYAREAEQQLAVPILVVNTSFLNVRTGPSAQFAVLTTVVGGTELPVLGLAGDDVWYQVSTAQGIGWVNIEFTLPRGDFTNVPLVQVDVQAQPITPVLPPVNTVPTTSTSPSTVVFPDAQPVTSGTEFVQGTRAFVTTTTDVRSAPSESGIILTTLYANNEDADYPVIGDTFAEGIAWVQVVLDDGRIGWMDFNKLGFRPGLVPVMTTPMVGAGAPGVVVDNSLGAGGGGTLPFVTPPQIEIPRAIVNTSFLNVRSGPGAQFTIVTTLRGGTELPVAGQTNDGAWLLVNGPFGQGWVNVEFILFRGTYDNVPIIQNPVGSIASPIVIISSSIPLYPGPGVNFGVIGQIVGPVEAPIVARTTEFDWVQINTSAGFGWVLAEQVIIRGDTSVIPIVN